MASRKPTLAKPLMLVRSGEVSRLLFQDAKISFYLHQNSSLQRPYISA